MVASSAYPELNGPVRWIRPLCATPCTRGVEDGPKEPESVENELQASTDTVLSKGVSGVAVRRIFEFFIVYDKGAKHTLIQRCQHGVEGVG